MMGLKGTKVCHQPSRACVTAPKPNLRHRSASVIVPKPSLHHRTAATTISGETAVKGNVVEELGTVISSDKKANWLAPKGDSKKAEGVVLFMHGFAQGPNAYYKMLKEIADQGFLVVAPEPPFAPTRGKQQEAMVEFAEHFRSKIHSNTLTGLELKSKNVGQNIMLLGHSVGAGLSTYVAGVAAENKQPFKKVMYMAPQTQVVKQYLPEAGIAKWPAILKGATEFALQYGEADELAPPELSKELMEQLKKAGLDLKAKNIKVFPQGTHVGFEDQVVLGDAEVASDILPWLDAILLALAAVGIPLYRLFKKEEEPSAPAPAAAAARSVGATATAGNGDDLEVVGVRKDGPGDLADLLLFNAAATKASKQPVGKWEAEGAQMMKAWKETKDGVGPPEPVDFVASYEEYVSLYVKLLVGVVGVGAALSLPGVFSGFQDGEIHWLSWIGLALTIYLGYKGATNLQLLNYVQNVQRPQSRDVARDFIISK